jgi:hypothetical protein
LSEIRVGPLDGIDAEQTFGVGPPARQRLGVGKGGQAQRRFPDGRVLRLLDGLKELALVEGMAIGAAQRLGQGARLLGRPGRLPVARLVEASHARVGNGFTQLRGIDLVGLHRRRVRSAAFADPTTP